MTKQDQFLKTFWRELLLGGLLLANILVWVRVAASGPGPLKVFFLDIGQGDAILVESPTHKYLLLDGGPNKNVLTMLGQILPFGTKEIDVMMESHPDRDHIGGLPEVAARYGVGVFIEPGVESDNSIDDLLHERLAARGVKSVLARRGMRVDFGDGAVLTILFPDRDVSRFETNEASIVARLDYGETSFLLTGDSPVKTERLLLSQNPALLDTDVLKVGHHGSRTSTTLGFAEAVSPAYAVISAGEGNSYGHPHQEVLDILQKVGAQIIATENVADLKGLGTIEFLSDGHTLHLK